MNDNSLLFDYGIDLIGRNIYFGGTHGTSDSSSDSTHDFNQMTVEMVVRAIHKMSSANKKPIKIHMQSYGGDAYALLYLVDVILSTPCQFKFYGGGAIMSAATWVMAVCDERYLYPSTRVLIHNGSVGHFGNKTDAEIKLHEENYLQDYLEKLYEKNSRMPASFWREVCKRDLYISAEEAIKLGLADAIIEPLSRGAFRSLRIQNFKKKVNKKEMQVLIDSLFQRIKAPVVKSLSLQVPEEKIDHSLIIEPEGDLAPASIESPTASEANTNQS